PLSSYASGSSPGGETRRRRAGTNERVGAVSSAGRAPALQAGGRWFDPSTANIAGAATRASFRTAPGGNRGKLYLLASTSAARISGGAASSSSALAISAAAISPLMCASRASSVAKVSKIQNVVGEVRAAYQATVPGSASASG